QSNPLHQSKDQHISVEKTSTVPARLAFSETHAVLRPLLSAVQTEEDLEDLVGQLRSIQLTRRANALLDPTPLNPKGRPRTARLTSSREERAKGGGHRKCGACRQRGHTRPHCPMLKP
ncbi:hypothetical protein EV359DRAFT_47762, partial [Lentinula novae-zelandiae]